MVAGGARRGALGADSVALGPSAHAVGGGQSAVVSGGRMAGAGPRPAVGANRSARADDRAGVVCRRWLGGRPSDLGRVLDACGGASMGNPAVSRFRRRRGGLPGRGAAARKPAGGSPIGAVPIHDRQPSPLEHFGGVGRGRVRPRRAFGVDVRSAGAGSVGRVARLVAGGGGVELRSRLGRIFVCGAASSSR